MSYNSSKLLDAYPLSSGMSEVDDLSDSDWLDIASNRESDDNDSVISGDSCSENMGLTPVSRRSSFSIGSSRDEDVDAWEGFVEGSGVEDAQSAEPATVMLPLTAVITESAMTTSEATASAMHDSVEEQRVNEALDQSMISTLSASRSSTASAHGSIRDLRLSFPDPLTSSQNELSYEDVPLSDGTLDTDVLADEINDVDHSAIAIDPFGLFLDEDLGSMTSIPVATQQSLDEDKTSFEVVLYGSPSSIKWSFVSALVRKAGLVSGHTLVEILPEDHHTHFLRLSSKTDDSVLSNIQVIPVYDKTEDTKDLVVVPSSQALVKRPSLAVVYLPLTMPMPVPADHTLYLPVLVTSSSMESNATQDIAKRDWDALSIPNDKVAHLDIDTEYPIINGSNTEDIRDVHAHRLFQRLLSVAKKRPVKVMSDHISPAQAVTFFALVSLIVGFAMNTAFRKSTAATPTVTTSAPVSTFWGMFGPEVNHTSVLATTARPNTPVMSTHKEFSLSVFNPGSTSLSIKSDNHLTKAGHLATPAVVESHCKPPTWADKVKSAKDIIVRPVIQLSIEAGPSTTVASQIAEASGSTLKSIGRHVDHVSQALDGRVARLRNEYRVDELIESLDELVRTIRRQTLYRVDKGKDKAQEIQNHVRYRHERARGKAKELKKKGEEIIYLAGTELFEKTNMAKKRARDITTKLASMESWRTYQKAHANWVTLLKEKGREGSNNRLRKESLKGKCKRRIKSSGHCSLFSRSLTDFYLA